MPTSLRIAIADDERETREFLHEVMEHLGHSVVAEAADGRKFLELCKTANPDLILADFKMPGLDGIDLAREINREKPVPVILISAYHHDAILTRLDNEAVMGYLVKPIKEADLKVLIAVARHRFQQYVTVAKEAAHLRQAMEDRKVTERAKGVVMRRLRLDEEEAFRRLRKFASDHNLKVTEVAQRVLTAEEIFHHLEG
jgi:two-component system, response regulator PdtaR